MSGEVSSGGQTVSRTTRVKELEEMVRKLESENKVLLGRVKSPKATSPQPRAVGDGGGGGGGKGALVEDENDTISLTDMEAGGEDEWLFVSPAHPPTPSQKKVSPLQWLSGGRGRQREEQGLPSLDDVKKTLLFHASEAESLATRASPGSESPPLRAKNRTAQKHLDRARARRDSPPTLNPPTEDSGLADDVIPKITWKRPIVPASKEGEGEGEEVPVVRWRAPKQVLDEGDPKPEGNVQWKVRVPSDPAEKEEEEEEEEVPKTKWKVRQVPETDQDIGDDVPKVNWKVKQVPENEEGDPVPKVNWKAKQVSEGDPVPKVNWKAKQVSEGDPVPKVNWKAKQVSEGDPVPTVNWKAKQVSEGDPVPKVNWKAKQVSEGDPVPKVNWKAKQVSEGDPVPKVSWKGKPPSTVRSPGRGPSGPARAQGERGEGSSQDEGTHGVQRVSRFGAHQSDLLKQSPSSSQPRRPPQNQPSRAREEQSPHDDSPTLRSRSPSPSLHSQLTRSRSPSPSVRQSRQTQATSSLHHSPRAARRQIPADKNSSAGNRTTVPPSSKLSPRKPSPSGVPRAAPGLTPPSRLPPGLPSGRGGTGPGGGVRRSLGNPSPGLQSPRQTAGSSASPSGQGRPRRTLPSSPSGSAKGGVKGATPQRRSLEKPRDRYNEPTDNSWLEGCY